MHVHRERLVGVLLAVVHVAQRGGTQHPVGAAVGEQALERGAVGQVERHEARVGVVRPRADRLVAAGPQRAQQGRAHLPRGPDHERAHAF